MILFKSPHMQRELAKVSPKLRQMVEIYEFLAWKLYGDATVITSIYRPDPKSVHAHFRGIDIAILENGKIEGSERLRQTLNVLFPYGKGDLETVPKLDHGTAAHSHLQCAA